MVMWLGVTGCAGARCAPTSIAIAQKEERARVVTVSDGVYRTTATGRLEPAERPAVVREYWVRSSEDEWYRVSEEQFASARVGESIVVCR